MEYVIKPMLREGKEPTGSMGDDTPPAAFSDVQRDFADFFRQKFAQVTNPPIDPYREKAVMSATIGIGEVGNPLIETPDRGHRLKNISPILSHEIFEALLSFGDTDKPNFKACYRNRFFTTGFTVNLQQSLQDLGDEVVKAVKDKGIRIVVLDDRVLDGKTRVMPMPMVIGYINRRLLKDRVRHLATIVAVTGEVINPHQACVLIGFGAVAIYPWMAYASGLTICENEQMTQRETRLALKNLYESLTKGILKVMSKMGISTVSIYRNAALFDILGLANEIVEACFPLATALIPGLGFAEIEERINRVHTRVFKKSYMQPIYPLAVGSAGRDNPGGEYHDFSEVPQPDLRARPQIRP
jgi:glutamate synthase (NADPH/NADH) large chain